MPRRTNIQIANPEMMNIGSGKGATDMLNTLPMMTSGGMVKTRG